MPTCARFLPEKPFYGGLFFLILVVSKTPEHREGSEIKTKGRSLFIHVVGESHRYFYQAIFIKISTKKFIITGIEIQTTRSFSYRLPKDLSDVWIILRNTEARGIWKGFEKFDVGNGQESLSRKSCPTSWHTKTIKPWLLLISIVLASTLLAVTARKTRAKYARWNRRERRQGSS